MKLRVACDNWVLSYPYHIINCSSYWTLWFHLYATIRQSTHTHTQSAQISQKQDEHNLYAITKTMCPPGYHHNDFVATHALGHMMYVSYTHTHSLTHTHTHTHIYIYIYVCIYIRLYIYIYIYIYSISHLAYYSYWF